MVLVSACSVVLSTALGVSAFGATLGQADDSPVVIEGGDVQARRAILDILPERDPPTTLFEAERIAEEAAERAWAWLRSEGYYSAEANPMASDDPPAARLEIAPGPRFRFSAPTLKYDDEAPASAANEAAARAIAGVEADAPARAQAVLEAERAALAALQSAGYPDAQTGQRRVVVDHSANTVATEFHFSAGTAAKLGAVRVEPATAFRQRFLDRLPTWKHGDDYTPDAVAALRRDLIATGAVARVTTLLAPADDDGVRDVVVEVEPAKKNAYELGLGWSTTEGLGVEAEWTRRNVTRRADSVTLGLEVGDMNQGLALDWERPHAFSRGRTLHLVGEVAREDNEGFTREGVELSASVDAAARADWGLSYGVSLAANRFDETAGVENAVVLSGFGDLHRDTTERPLDARSGTVLDLRIEPAVSTGDATLGFVRTSGEARAYYSIGEAQAYTLAARTRVGWVQPVSGTDEDIPPDRRFYAGGGGSVRGYEYNSIYPEERAALGLTPGGQGLLEVGLEARARWSETWGAAVFIDGGAAFDAWEDAADLRWGAGIGARYNLGFAPLRVDLAVPLDARAGDPDYALYISLGQAF